VGWSGGPVVVVINALDEFRSETDRKVLMQALSKAFLNLPSFIRVIVVSCIRKTRKLLNLDLTHLLLNKYK
jgi:hypothetical protein